MKNDREVKGTVIEKDINGKPQKFVKLGNNKYYELDHNSKHIPIGAIILGFVKSKKLKARVDDEVTLTSIPLNKLDAYCKLHGFKSVTGKIVDVDDNIYYISVPGSPVMGLVGVNRMAFTNNTSKDYFQYFIPTIALGVKN